MHLNSADTLTANAATSAAAASLLLSADATSSAAPRHMLTADAAPAAATASVSLLLSADAATAVAAALRPVIAPLGTLPDLLKLLEISCRRNTLNTRK
jgi:hypothetical protein